jgi:hypothetical protein
MASPKDVIFFGANSRYPLYLLWRTPPQQDAAATRASIFDYKSLILFQFLIL